MKKIENFIVPENEVGFDEWGKYAPFFTFLEMKCKHTGACHMDREFMDVLLTIRKEYDKPMKITSGYRHTTHPAEAGKGSLGEHSLGRAVDVACDGLGASELVTLALRHGITRIGISQRLGQPRYIHLGMGGHGLPEPRIWSY